MKNQKINIVLLNYCTNKEKKWTRLTYYILDDEIKHTDYVVGVVPITSFVSGEVFDLLDDKILFKKIEATLKSIQDYKSPLDTKNILTSLEYNGKVISCSKSKD